MIKLLIGILIIACIAPLFIKGPDGEPVMTLDDWSISLPDSVTDLFEDGLPTSALSPAGDDAPEPTTTTVYKWQDEEGQWHFSNTPPKELIAEEMEISSDINLMDAYVPPPEPEQQQAAASAMPQIPGGAITATPEQVQEMMETVTNLQETIDQRKADMDEIAQPAAGN